MTNCKNCGAPIEPEKDRCSYCGTCYNATGGGITFHTTGITAAVAASVLTPNEARRLLGIRSPSRLMSKEGLP